MILLPERAGEDEHLAAQLRPAGHGLERPAPDEERVELREQLAEIDLRVLDNPVVFTVRSRDIAVQAGGDGIADAPHGDSSLDRPELSGIGAELRSVNRSPE